MARTVRRPPEGDMVLGDPADVEAEFVGHDEEFLCVAVGAGDVAVAALDMGEETKPEAWSLARHGWLPFVSGGGRGRVRGEYAASALARPSTRSSTAVAPPSDSRVPRQTTCWSGRIRTLAVP